MKEKKQTFCILGKEYQETIFAAASAWVIFQYTNNQHMEPGFYRKFFLKVRGYVVVGFKTNYVDTKTATVVSEWRGMIDALEKIPVESIFLPEKIGKRIMSMEANGYLVETTGKMAWVKTKRFELPCFITGQFLKELTEEETRKMKSVDAFVAGYL